MSPDLASSSVPPHTLSSPLRRAWPLAGLLALLVIPTVASVARLASFVPGGPVLSDAARFAARPLVLATHIVSGMLFSLVGAAQFSAALRRARPSLHRRLGYVLAPAGLVAGLSALAALAVYPRQPMAGPALQALRVVAAVAMVAELVAGLSALRRRDFAAHGAWMTRAWSLGIAPGTQALLLAPLTLLFGVDTELTYTLGMGLGWAVNAVVAERVVRRARRARPPATRP